MKNLAFVIYRKWAFDIFLTVVSNLEREGLQGNILLITTPDAEFDLSFVPASVRVEVCKGSDNATIARLIGVDNIEVAFFYGWSWIVTEHVLNSCICLCLHPSMLPLYRGGTPLQHQIIAGEEEGGVSLFKMGKGIDDGDIYAQEKISLLGSLDVIFERIVTVGVEMTLRFIGDFHNNHAVFVPQLGLDAHKAYPRRRPEQSEILVSDLPFMARKDFLNKVRALAAPYPNAYIQFKDGRLFIENASLLEGAGVLSQEINPQSNFSEQNLSSQFNLFLKDGKVKINSFRFEPLAK